MGLFFLSNIIICYLFGSNPKEAFCSKFTNASNAEAATGKVCFTALPSLEKSLFQCSVLLYIPMDGYAKPHLCCNIMYVKEGFVAKPCCRTAARLDVQSPNGFNAAFLKAMF